MSATTTEKKHRRMAYPNGKKGHVLTAIISMAILIGGFYGVGALTSPPPNTNCPVGYQSAPGLTASDSQCVHLTVVITNQDHFANVGMISEGFTPNCYAFCNNGITYTLDPTVLITNGGHGFEQCKVFGTGSSETCQSGDSAVIIGLSSAGVSPASTDYSAAGPCTTTASGNYVFSGTSSGLSDVKASTITPQVDSSTVTTTISNTFTALGTQNNLQTACLLTELTSGATPVVYAEGTFGPDSLVSGNTIQITWSIART